MGKRGGSKSKWAKNDIVKLETNQRALIFQRVLSLNGIEDSHYEKRKRRRAGGALTNATSQHVENVVFPHPDIFFFGETKLKNCLGPWNPIIKKLPQLSQLLTHALSNPESNFTDKIIFLNDIGSIVSNTTPASMTGGEQRRKYHSSWIDSDSESVTSFLKKGSSSRGGSLRRRHSNVSLRSMDDTSSMAYSSNNKPPKKSQQQKKHSKKRSSRRYSSTTTNTSDYDSVVSHQRKESSSSVRRRRSRRSLLNDSSLSTSRHSQNNRRTSELIGLSQADSNNNSISRSSTNLGSYETSPASGKYPEQRSKRQPRGFALRHQDSQWSLISEDTSEISPQSGHLTRPSISRQATRRMSTASSQTPLLEEFLQKGSYRTPPDTDAEATLSSSEFMNNNSLSSLLNGRTWRRRGRHSVAETEDSSMLELSSPDLINQSPAISPKGRTDNLVHNPVNEQTLEIPEATEEQPKEEVSIVYRKGSDAEGSDSAPLPLPSFQRQSTGKMSNVRSKQDKPIVYSLQTVNNQHADATKDKHADSTAIYFNQTGEDSLCSLSTSRSWRKRRQDSRSNIEGLSKEKKQEDSQRSLLPSQEQNFLSLSADYVRQRRLDNPVLRSSSKHSLLTPDPSEDTDSVSLAMPSFQRQSTGKMSNVRLEQTNNMDSSSQTKEHNVDAVKAKSEEYSSGSSLHQPQVLTKHMSANSSDSTPDSTDLPITLPMRQSIHIPPNIESYQSKQSNKRSASTPEIAIQSQELVTDTKKANMLPQTPEISNSSSNSSDGKLKLKNRTVLLRKEDSPRSLLTHDSSSPDDADLRPSLTRRKNDTEKVQPIANPQRQVNDGTKSIHMTQIEQKNMGSMIIIEKERQREIRTEEQWTRIIADGKKDNVECPTPKAANSKKSHDAAPSTTPHNISLAPTNRRPSLIDGAKSDRMMDLSSITGCFASSSHTESNSQNENAEDKGDEASLSDDLKTEVEENHIHGMRSERHNIIDGTKSDRMVDLSSMTGFTSSSRSESNPQNKNAEDEGDRTSISDTRTELEQNQVNRQRSEREGIMIDLSSITGCTTPSSESDDKDGSDVPNLKAEQENAGDVKIERLPSMVAIPDMPGSTTSSPTEHSSAESKKSERSSLDLSNHFTENHLAAHPSKTFVITKKESIGNIALPLPFNKEFLTLQNQDAISTSSLLTPDESLPEQKKATRSAQAVGKKSKSKRMDVRTNRPSKDTIRRLSTSVEPEYNISNTGESFRMQRIVSQHKSIASLVSQEYQVADKHTFFQKSRKSGKQSSSSRLNIEKALSNRMPKKQYYKKATQQTKRDCSDNESESYLQIHFPGHDPLTEPQDEAFPPTVEVLVRKRHSVISQITCDSLQLSAGSSAEKDSLAAQPVPEKQKSTVRRISCYSLPTGSCIEEKIPAAAESLRQRRYSTKFQTGFRNSEQEDTAVLPLKEKTDSQYAGSYEEDDSLAAQSLVQRGGSSTKSQITAESLNSPQVQEDQITSGSSNSGNFENAKPKSEGAAIIRPLGETIRRLSAEAASSFTEDDDLPDQSSSDSLEYWTNKVKLASASVEYWTNALTMLTEERSNQHSASVSLADISFGDALNESGDEDEESGDEEYGLSVDVSDRVAKSIGTSTNAQTQTTARESFYSDSSRSSQSVVAQSKRGRKDADRDQLIFNSFIIYDDSNELNNPSIASIPPDYVSVGSQSVSSFNENESCTTTSRSHHSTKSLTAADANEGDSTTSALAPLKSCLKKNSQKKGDLSECEEDKKKSRGRSLSNLFASVRKKTGRGRRGTSRSTQ